MPEEIGSLSIRLELDREEFDRDLQLLEGVDSSVAIATKLNTDGISRQLQAFQGEVAVGLRLDKGQIEQQLRELGTQSGLEIAVGLRLNDSGVLGQARQLTDQLEQQFGQVKLHLKPTVDDSALTKLNQHLDLKQRHFAQVRRDFRNPVKPAIDTSEIDAASAQFDALKQKIAEFQSQAASVRFTADTSEVDAQINRLQGKRIRLKSTVEGGESSATESADIFAKAIAKAIKKSNSKGIFGSLFDGIGSIVSAPFKIVGATISNVFAGVGLGVGEQISKDLGKGLFAGIEDELSPLIGSFKLLGREAGSALTKEILNALGQDGVLIQNILGDLIGQEKILAESGASQSRSKKERNQARVEATRFFAEERRENDVVAIAKERRKLFVEQPAQAEEIEEGLNRKVSRGVQKLDSKRIEQIDQGKLDQQSELAQKLFESENAKLAQIRSRLTQQRQAIAAAEQKVADLGRIDNKSPEFQAARADLNAQKTAFAQTKKEELTTASNVSGAKEKLGELADAPKSIQTQIKNAAKRSAAESKRLETLQRSLSQQGQAIAAAEEKVGKLQEAGDNSPELSKAEADLAVKKQRFAETQQDASVVASSVERYASKLTDLSDKLSSLQELATKAFKGEFEKLDRLKEQLLVNQREFAKKGQILESAKVLGTIQNPETIDSEIAQGKARVQDLQSKRTKIAATSKREGGRLREVQELKAEDLAQARKGGVPLASAVLTPEQVKAGKLEARPIQQQADQAIQKLQLGQIQRQALYKNLTKEIEQEERLLRSLAAQKSDPLARKSQANTLRQALADLIQLEKDSSPEEAQAALQKGDEARAKRLLAQRKFAIAEQAKIKRELALLGEEASGATQSVQSAPSPQTPKTAAPKPTQTAAPKPQPAPVPRSTPAEDLYNQALQRTVQALTGQSLPADQVPQFKPSDQIRGKAQYNAGNNAISLKPELFEALSAPLTKDSIASIETALVGVVHEATHGAQFNFGKTNPFNGDANPVQGFLDPTTEEIKTFGARIEGSTNKGVAEDPRVVSTRRELETQAYLAEGRIGKPIAQDLIKQKAIGQFQQVGGVGGQKLRDSFSGLYTDLNRVAKEAKDAGIEISADQQAIIQKLLAIRQQVGPLVEKAANLEILPTEEILDLQEEFEKSVGTLVPIAGDIQRLKEKVAGKAAQAGIAQPGAIGPTSGQAAATNFKSTLGLGAGKLKGNLEQAENAVAATFEEITQLAVGLGIESAQEIQDAIANIQKAKADLEPLFDKAAQVDILPAEEIAALQEQIQAKVQAAIGIIESQPDIAIQRLEAKAPDGGGDPVTQEVTEPTTEPQAAVIPQAQPQPLAIPLPELKAEAKGELVQVEAAPIAKVKTASEVAKQLGTQAGKTFRAAADAGGAIADKAKQTAQVVANTGQQVFNVVRQINPDEALEQAKNIASSFSGTYKDLKDALSAQKKALKKGDFSAAKKLGEKARQLGKEVFDLADKAQQDIAGLTSSLGDAAAFGTDLGSKLANKKAQISRVRNEVTRVQKVGKLDDTAGAIDVSATSSPVEDDGLAAFGDFQKQIDERFQKLLQLAKSTLTDEAFLTDQAVNIGGLVGGKIGSQLGPVGEAGGDLIGALATRQAITLGKAGNTAFNTIKDTDDFKQASRFEKLILLTRQLKKELQSPELQKALGGELTGDIAGFVVGNIASKLGGAGLQALGGAVPGTQLLSMVPQGAIAASLAVPRIVEARERFASNTEAVPDDGLAAFGDINLEIQKRYQRIAKLLNLSGGSSNLNTAEIQAKLQELDREIDQRVGDRLDLLEVEVALGSSAPASIPEPEAPEVEAAEFTQRRIRKQKAIALSPEQQQRFAALEIEAERDLNESLPPESLGKAARFDADAERIENQINRTFERGARQDPLISKPATAGDRLKASAGKELGEYREALGKGVGQLGLDLSKLPGLAESVFGKLAEGPKVLNDAFKGLLGNVGNLAKGFAAFQGIQFAANILSNLGQQALSASIRLDNLRTALNYSSGGEDAGGRNLEFVNRQVDEFGVPLVPSIEGFTKLSASTKGTAIEGKATEDIFTGVSSAATVLGLTADQTSGVFLAFSQAMSKGKLSMEELQQIGERVPGTFSLVARSLGVSEAQLAKMLQTGQVLSEDALPKIGKEFIKTFGGSAKTASDNAQSSIFKLQNSITRLQQSTGDMIKPAASVGAKALAGAFDFLAKNSDKVVAVLGVAAAVTIPGILAGLAVLGSALVGLATTTFPFLATAAAASFAALGPVTLAIAAVGAVAATVAEPGARALANALNGTTQSAIDAVDALAALDSRYNKLLTKKGGASKEEVAGISQEIRTQAAQGEYLPGATIQKNQQVAEQLIAQLERVAAASRAAAEAKRQLLKSIKDSAEAFANENSRLDIQDVNQQRVIQEGVNRGDLTEDQARQLNIDGQKTILTERADLQENRLSDLNTQLQGLQKDPSSSPEYLEQVTKIQEEIKTGELQLAQTRLQLAQSVAEGKKNAEQDILKSFQDANAQAEAAIRKSETDRIAGIRGKQLKGGLTADQAEAQITTVKQDSATKDYNEAKRQLSELDRLKAEGGLPAEEIAKRELELNQKLSDANLRRIEAQIAARDIEKRRIIENLDLANQKAESAIALSATTTNTATKQKVLSGDLTQEDAAIAQTETQEDTTRKRIAQIKRELQQNEQLRADGTRNAKDAIQKELQLKQQLAEANGQLVDSEIQKQEQLRAAIERTFQRQQEQLKLVTKQTANQIDRDALTTLQSGPVDSRGLELQTQGLKLKNDGSEIAQNLTLSQQQLAAIDALGQKDQAAADKRKALALQIAELQGQLIANEKEQFLNAREQEIRAIEERAAAQKRAAEEAIAGVQQQKDANDLLLSSLDAQSKLLESRNGLQKALLDVDLAQLNSGAKDADRGLKLRSKLNDKNLKPAERQEVERQLRVSGLNPNDSELALLKRKQEFETRIASEKLKAMIAEQAFQRKALELDLQRQRIAAENLILEAEMGKLRAEANQVEAKANLETAKASGDSTKIAEAESKLKLADREVDLSDRKFANAQSNLGIQDELSGNARATLGAKQQKEFIDFNSEQGDRESDANLTLAGAAPTGNRRTFKPRRAQGSSSRIEPVAQIRANIGSGQFPASPIASLQNGVEKNQFPASPVASIRTSREPVQIPTSKPVEIPSAAAPSPSNKMTDFNDSLRLAVSALTAMRPQIDKIAQELSKPRVENLYVSTPTPVSDAGSILSDIAYQGAVGAGLA